MSRSSLVVHNIIAIIIIMSVGKFRLLRFFISTSWKSLIFNIDRRVVFIRMLISDSMNPIMGRDSNHLRNVLGYFISIRIIY